MDFENSGSWIRCKFWRGFHADCAYIDGRILGPKRTLNDRSFFSLGQYVDEFTQIISFFKQSSFKRRCETVIRILLCFGNQACCLLY